MNDRAWTKEEIAQGYRGIPRPPGRDGDLARELVGVERMDRKPGEPFMGYTFNFTDRSVTGPETVPATNVPGQRREPDRESDGLPERGERRAGGKSGGICSCVRGEYLTAPDPKCPIHAKPSRCPQCGHSLD